MTGRAGSGPQPQSLSVLPSLTPRARRHESAPLATGRWSCVTGKLWRQEDVVCLLALPPSRLSDMTRYLMSLSLGFLQPVENNGLEEQVQELHQGYQVWPCRWLVPKGTSACSATWPGVPNGGPVSPGAVSAWGEGHLCNLSARRGAFF